MFGSIKLPKDMKENVKKSEYLKEFKLNEMNLKKLIVKVDRNIDLISETSLIFDEGYIINEGKIRQILENFKKYYDLIIIDTGSDTKCFNITKTLTKACDKIVCLVEGNLISVRKNMNLLNSLELDKEKVGIIYNKKSKYSMKAKLVEMVFLKYEMLGVLNYDNKYNHIINKNVNRLYISKKIRKEFEKILNRF